MWKGVEAILNILKLNSSVTKKNLNGRYDYDMTTIFVLRKINQFLKPKAITRL